MLDLGITKDDFNAMTWLTSWAVDADHGSDLCGTGSFDLQIRYDISICIIKRYGLPPHAHTSKRRGSSLV